MEDCSKRAKELCALNLKGFALESRVNAVKSAVGVVCLAVVTVAMFAWMDFIQPKDSEGQEVSLSNMFRGWGLGCANGEFREFIVTMALTAVPTGLTIAGMTWGARVRPKSSVYHGEWLQDVVDTVRREMTAWVILFLNAYVCGVAVVLFWIDALLRGNGVASLLSAIFLSTVCLFSASLPALMKVGDGVAVSSYAYSLLTLRRIALWRYYHKVSPRYSGFNKNSWIGRIGRSEIGQRRLFRALVALVLGVSSLLLWLAVCVYVRPSLQLGLFSLSFIVLGGIMLWLGVVVLVSISTLWVRVPGSKLGGVELWLVVFILVVSCSVGCLLQLAGYRVMDISCWLAVLLTVGGDSVLGVLVWRTLHERRRYSLWPLVLGCVSVEQRRMANTMVRPLGKSNVEDYIAVADLIVPGDLFLDGKGLRLRDFINEMMLFDDVSEE